MKENKHNILYTRKPIIDIDTRHRRKKGRVNEYIDHIKTTPGSNIQDQSYIKSFEILPIPTKTPNTLKWITQYIQKTQQRRKKIHEKYKTQHIVTRILNA